MPRRVAIVPARLASRRLERKMLLAESGMPLFLHTVLTVRPAACLDEVAVATDSEEIVARCSEAGVRVFLTDPALPSGSDRVRAAARQWGLSASDIVVNVQGDEPSMSAAVVDEVVERLEQDPGLGVVTQAFPITPDEAQAPDLVKVVCTRAGRALYFSRAPIPYHRDRPGEGTFLGHAGIYAYRMRALEQFSGSTPSPLEQAERLEQLRLLEDGIEIGVVVGPRPGRGIDTRQDYDAFLADWRARAAPPSAPPGGGSS